MISQRQEVAKKDRIFLLESLWDIDEMHFEGKPVKVEDRHHTLSKK